MTTRKPQPSSWLSYLLMGAVLSFGAGAAVLVLKGTPAGSLATEVPNTSAQGPVATAAGLATPSGAASAALSAPSSQSAASPRVTAQSAVSEGAASAVAADNRSASASARTRAARGESDASNPSETSTAQESSRAKRRHAQDGEPAFIRTPRKLRGEVIERSEPAPADSAKATAEGKASAKGEGKSDSKSDAKSDSKSDTKSDAKPDSKAESKADNKSSPANAEPLEATRPVVKSVHATALTPVLTKPAVVMANGDKVWVKLDEQRTVIVTKGQDVPGLGVFHGSDGKSAKFESGALPVNP